MDRGSISRNIMHGQSPMPLSCIRSTPNKLPQPPLRRHCGNPPPPKKKTHKHTHTHAHGPSPVYVLNLEALALPCEDLGAETP
jgi:hypothetical protein